MSHPTVICIPHSPVICILHSQCQLLLPPNSVIYILHPTVSFASSIQRCHLHPLPNSVISIPHPTVSSATPPNDVICIPHQTMLFPFLIQVSIASLILPCYLYQPPNCVICNSYQTESTEFPI